MQSEISDLPFKAVVRAGNDQAIRFIVLPGNVANERHGALFRLRAHDSALGALACAWETSPLPETVFVLLRFVSNPSRAPLGMPSCSKTDETSIPKALACAITPKTVFGMLSANLESGSPPLAAPSCPPPKSTM